MHALFCNLYRRAYHMASQDDGLTWSHPVDITAALSLDAGVAPRRLDAVTLITQLARDRDVAPAFDFMTPDG